MDIVNIFNQPYKFQNKSYSLKDVIKFYVKKTLDSVEKIENYKDFIYDKE